MPLRFAVAAAHALMRYARGAMADIHPEMSAVLRANADFYRAFSAGDYRAMSQLWAQRSPLSCVHPGAPALIGREPVLESWRQILREPLPFQMRCDHAHAEVIGSFAIVTCYEGNDDQPAHLVATNLFTREDGTWRMLHHHAGPLSTPLRQPATSSDVN
ncbi:MAG TPA: nuclear transport factor 2 family protein [Polyangiales bacterium]|nr:nuclear transport factor 2 family protein [Polyangiales bacterium]